jgi:hypothetical protein
MVKISVFLTNAIHMLIITNFTMERPVPYYLTPPATWGDGHQRKSGAVCRGNPKFVFSFLRPTTSSLLASRKVSPAKRLLPASRKSFAPTVVQIPVDAFLAAQLGNARFTAQTFQHDADLFFC